MDTTTEQALRRAQARWETADAATRAARDAHTAARDARRDARHAREHAIMAAIHSGESITSIARVLGVARAYVHEIAGRHR